MALFQSRPDLVRVKDENIVSTWHALVPDAAGQCDKFFTEVENALKQIMPDLVGTDRKEIEISSKSAPKESRTCLRVMRKNGLPETGYHAYFSTEDIGKHLIVSRVVENKGSPLWGIFNAEEVSAYLSLIGAAGNAAKDVLLAGKQEIKMANANKEGGIIDIV